MKNNIRSTYLTMYLFILKYIYKTKDICKIIRDAEALKSKNDPKMESSGHFKHVLIVYFLNSRRIIDQVFKYFNMTHL